MSINATLLAQMVVFAVLVWFTMKFVWPMLQRAMQERETRIADGLAAAEKGQRDLEEAEQSVAGMLQEGRDKAHDFVSQAQKRAEEIVEEAKAHAREEADRLVLAARAQIDQERNLAREALRGEVAVLAIKGAEQVLMREVDGKAHSDTLAQLARQL